MSPYIGSGQKIQFDVGIQELVPKVQNSGGIFEKKRFLGSTFEGFAISVLLQGPFPIKYRSFSKFPRCFGGKNGLSDKNHF